VVSDTSGAQVSAIKYYPFGTTRSGSVPTDKQFTGQRLDGTGLYYYNARYYDPQIGRFISADSIVPNKANQQDWNRYSYCLNNPLKYNDPSGHDTIPGDYYPGNPDYFPWPDEYDEYTGGGNDVAFYLAKYGRNGETLNFYMDTPINLHASGTFGNLGYPLGNGRISIYGHSTIKDGVLTVDLNIFDGWDTIPFGTDLKYTAIVNTGSSETPIYLFEPEGPWLMPYYRGGTDIREGQVEIDMSTVSSQPTLDIVIGASNNFEAACPYPNFAVSPSAWHINLQTGEMTYEIPIAYDETITITVK
jgi:RHS repeat-associated protein